MDQNLFGMTKSLLIALLLTGLASTLSANPIPQFKFRAVEIDNIEIGYGLQLTDLNGDLSDERQTRLFEQWGR